MEFRKPLIERIAELLNIEKDDIIDFGNNTFVVNATTGVYEIKPTSRITPTAFDVTLNDVTYQLTIKQTRVVLHSWSNISLCEFAKEFGINLDPELSKNIWIVPDAVFCNLKNYTKGAITEYLNVVANTKDITTNINKINDFIESNTSRNGDLLFDDLQDIASMATVIASNEEYFAKIKEIASFIDADVFGNAIHKYMEMYGVSIEKIINTIDKLNDFKLEVIVNAFCWGGMCDGPSHMNINDFVTGFGLVISDRNTSYFDLVQMMFYDASTPDSIIRGIRVPLGLFIERMREHGEPSLQMSTTEFVIRKMAWTIVPYDYYKIGIDWFDTYQYANDKYDRYLTDAIYIFRDKDVSVKSLSKELDEMNPNPASEELQHLLTIIKEDCRYDEDEGDEE